MLQRLNALLNAAQTLSSSLKIEEILDSMIQEIRNIMDLTDAILIFLYDEEQGALVPYRTYGILASKAAALRIVPGETIAGKVFETKHSILLPTCETSRQAMSTMSSQNLKAYQDSLGAPIYPESIICAPMLYRDKCLGVITIDRFIPDTPYTEVDAQIFESVANLAGAAIANSQMYQQLNLAHEQLSHSVAINKTLAVASLRGQGLKQVCETLSEMLACHIAIYNENLELVSYNHDFRWHVKDFSQELQSLLPQFPVSVSSLKPSRCTLSGLSAYIVPISDGLLFSGYAVYAGFPASSFSLIENVNEISGLLLAIELMRLEREQQLKEEFIGESLNALLEGHSDEQVLSRLQKLSPTLNQGNHVIVIMELSLPDRSGMPDSNELMALKRLQRILIHRISFHNPRPIYTYKDKDLIALYPFPASVSGQKIYQTIQAFYKELQASLPLKDFGFFVSCGRVAKCLDELPQSLTDARLGLQYLDTVSGQRQIIFFHQLGIRKLLFQHSREELQGYVQDILSPVLLHDENHHSDFIKTLEVFTQHQRSVKDTIAALSIHKNTLNYRLKKIRELLSMDSVTGPSWSDIELALDIKAYLEETKSGGIPGH